MSMKKTLVAEFERRVFTESYGRIFKCLTLLDENDLWKSPNSTIPAVGNLILHLCGNARQWILSGIGDKPDNRERELEFLTHLNIKKSDLIFLLENLKVNMRQTLNEMEEGKLNKGYIIQGFNETGFSVIIHVLEHFSYHTGQITTLTKLFRNKETGYYEGLNLDQMNNLN
jgi:uncharacterized damage-inducible protein DinB